MQRCYTWLCACLLMFCYSSSPANNVHLTHSVIGIGVNVTQYQFNGQYVGPTNTTNELNNHNVSGSVSLGTDLTPSLAIQLFTLVRPLKSFSTTLSNGTHIKSSVKYNVFALTAIPKMKLNLTTTLYGKVGLAYFVQYPFSTNNTALIKTSYSVSPLLAAGLEYRFSKKLSASVEAGTTFKRHNKPSMRYASINAFYHFYYSPSKPNLGIAIPRYHLNKHELGFHLLPAYNFKKGSTLQSKKIRHYQMLEYLSLLVQQGQHWALYWGTSVAHFSSRAQRQSIYSFSILPLLRYTFYHSSSCDSYIGITLAGPTYISQTTIDNTSIGKHFIFFDGVQWGIRFGRQKAMSANLELLHYSNGGLFHPNPGITMPLALSIGYSF